MSRKEAVVPVVRLLGPVDVIDSDGLVHTPGSPIRTCLLALLALETGKVVDAVRLLDTAWNGEPPASGLRALRFHISKLRSELPIDDLIATVGSGYRLNADTDLAQAEGAANGSMSGPDLLGQALDSWRGDPLGDTSECSALEHEQQRINELRLSLTERLYRAHVDDGTGPTVIADLSRICLDNPLRERLWSSLITAHYQAGNQGEALRAYDRLRLNLADTLGVDPSPELQALQLQVLDQDTELTLVTPKEAASPPSGTVTFLFTDIEGSTRLWEEQPEEMRSELAHHDEILRTAIESREGYIFATGGDGFAAAFHTPRAALDAANVIQGHLSAAQSPAGLNLKVRMGIHAGTADERDGDYFGRAPTRAARIMAAGHGGQVLLSAAAAELLGTNDLVDLGPHRLRDLSSAEYLFQAGEANFGPLRTVDTVPGNLREQPSTFIGRETELTELSDLVSHQRLVTLTGVGGVGKTRLAVQLAAELVPQFPDGVWLVELAALADPDAVAETVTSALRLTRQGQSSGPSDVAQALVGQRLLLVLDNCEHVLDAAADLAEEILAVTRQVVIVATSREGLRVEGEHLWPVPSLGTDTDERSPAVELFIDRTRALIPDFDEEEHLEDIEEICRRLDGIALAIELAAARMVSMSAADLQARLADRFRLLTGRRRGLERHQTLQNAVQWSYELLEPNERTLLERCSVFAGSFDLPAVTAVCSDGKDEYATLDLLDALVRKSLLVADRSPESVRYSMLETIRQFAEDQLAAAGDLEALTDRHAHFYATVTRELRDVWQHPRQSELLGRLERDFGNLRAAFGWARSTADLDTATSIVVNVSRAAFVMDIHEVSSWAEELLTDGRVMSHPRAVGVLLAAGLCTFVGRADEGVGYVERALPLLNDPRYELIGGSHALAAIPYVMAGRPDEYLRLHRLQLELDPSMLLSRSALAGTLGTLGRTAEAAEYTDGLVEAAYATASPGTIVMALGAWVSVHGADHPEAALAALRSALALAEESSGILMGSVTQGQLAHFEADHGDPHEARTHFAAAINHFHRTGKIPNLLDIIGQLARCIERRCAMEPAVILATAALTNPAAASLMPELPALHARLKASLSASAWAEIEARVAGMDRGELVAYAHAQLPLLT